MSTGEDYSQVLIPDKVVVASRERIKMPLSLNKPSSSKDNPLRWLSFVAVFLTGVIAVATVAVIRYESKIGEYETRISELETDLDTFFQVLAEEIDYERGNHPKIPTRGSNKKKLDDGNTEEEGFRVFADDLEEKIHPHSKPIQDKDGKQRRKREVIDLPRFPTVPDSFGPEIERTDDGVPIVDRSYQASSSIRRGEGNQNPPRRSERIIAPQPTPDSVGLSLYEGLVATGGRNEPKSLDFGNTDGQDSLLPHHKVSAAWSEKGASQYPSRIQLRSGDTGDDDRYGGPRFANEMTYTRSRPSVRNLRPVRPITSTTQVQTRPAAGVTFHRNSRVAATYSSGIDNYGGGGGARVAPTTTRPLRRRKINRGGVDDYPPLRTLGHGQGEVIARVIQDEDRQPQYIQRRRQSWDGDRKSAALRNSQQHQQQQQQYLSRRPVETFRRPVAPVTEHPSGYSERQGPLNVTINRSIPFGTYYSSSRGNWEVNTQETPRYYRNRY